MDSTLMQGSEGSGGRGAGVPPNVANGSILTAFYTRPYPTADDIALELADADVDTLEEVVAELRGEVAALLEETGVLGGEVEVLRARRAAPGGGPGANAAVPPNAGVLTASQSTSTRPWDEAGNGADRHDDHSIQLSNPNASLASSTTNYDSTTRRGQRYRRRSQAELDQYVSVEDKSALLAKEMDRVKQQEERGDREALHVSELLAATVEEAARRMKELRLEVQYFHRDVIGNAEDDDENGAAGNGGNPMPPSADEMMRYMDRRLASQGSYMDKLKGQCQAAEQDILRAQQELRQRRAAGEAFHAIDFEQLRIENQQFNERIDKKNAELADLKGTSTRTVQTLNTLTDALNDLLNEQAQLKKESRTRSEYLARCTREAAVAEKGAAEAEQKNTTIKAQHAAVKVPKIEEYIAQKAELFELEKAARNWTRKVEIAEGQMKVMRQQVRHLTSQRDAAVAYSQDKKKTQASAQQGPWTMNQPSAARPPISSGGKTHPQRSGPTTLSRGRGSGSVSIASPTVGVSGPPSVGPVTPRFTAVNSMRSLLELKRTSTSSARGAAKGDVAAVVKDSNATSNGNTSPAANPATPSTQ